MTVATPDLDGDGASDSFAVFAQIEKGTPIAWRAEARLSSGARSTLRLSGSPHSYPTVVGAVDADGDGDDEVFVKVYNHLYHGAGQAVLQIHMWHHDTLRRARRDGDALEFRVGGVTQWGEGAHCDDVDGDGRPELVLHRVETRGHSYRRWTFVQRAFDWRGASLRPAGTKRGTIRPDGYTDPRVRFFYGLRCRSFDPPYPY